jgi:hypothetical protein
VQIAFTGSTEVGRRIGAEAAKSLKPCTLELGGKSPVIVCPGVRGVRVAAEGAGCVLGRTRGLLGAAAVIPAKRFESIHTGTGRKEPSHCVPRCVQMLKTSSQCKCGSMMGWGRLGGQGCCAQCREVCSVVVGHAQEGGAGLASPVLKAIGVLALLILLAAAAAAAAQMLTLTRQWLTPTSLCSSTT